MAIRYLSGINVDSNTLFVDSTNNRVGIGTASPGAKLTVQSGINTASSTVISLLQTTNGAEKAAAGIGLSIQNGGESTNAADLWFTTASGGSTSERMRIISDGSVGIGVTSTGNNVKVKIKAASEGTGIGLSSATLVIARSATDTQLGIGYYTTPDAWVISSTYGTDGAYKPLAFATSDTERMRITSGGNVLIGTTTDAGYKLRVNGTGRYDGNVQLYADSAGNSPRLIFGGETSSTDKSIFLESFYVVFQGHDNEGFRFQTTDSSGVVSNRMLILGTGTIRLSNYGSGSKTGTVAYNLAVDSSGNIIETAGGVVDGSGTANMVAKWSDANTLTDSGIEDTSSSVSIGRAAFYSPSNYGTYYSALTGASSGTAWYDTITGATGPRVYNMVVRANPNADGSSSYADFYFGKVFVGTGYNGSAVVHFINYQQESQMPRSLYGSGGGNLTITAFFVVGGTESTEVANGATYTIRIKIAGYNNAGAGTEITLQRIM